MAGTADVSFKMLDTGQHFGSGSGILLAGGWEPCTAHGGAQLALQAPGLPHMGSFPSLMALASCTVLSPHPVGQSHLEYGPTGIFPFTKGASAQPCYCVLAFLSAHVS